MSAGCGGPGGRWRSASRSGAWPSWGSGWCAGCPPRWPCSLVAGAADVISSVFRMMIVQQVTPDAMQGRVNSLIFAGLQGGPRLGDAEAGAAAAIWAARSSPPGPAACSACRRRGDLLGDSGVLAIPEHRRGWPGGAAGAPGERAGAAGRRGRRRGPGDRRAGAHPSIMIMQEQHPAHQVGEDVPIRWTAPVSPRALALPPSAAASAVRSPIRGPKWIACPAMLPGVHGEPAGAVLPDPAAVGQEPPEVAWAGGG